MDKILQMDSLGLGVMMSGIVVEQNGSIFSEGIADAFMRMSDFPK
ncbi:hypothetical protein NXG27_04775 [Megasphaera paucivorans]|nr:hypothetical protein [Megasphaera paucivorans]